MYWVVQSNIYAEENFDNLIRTLERFAIPFSTHKAVPFIGVIEPEPVIPKGSRVIVMGSYSLAKHACNRGWQPGAFLDNLDFRIQHANWGEYMLNADAKIYPFAEIPFQEQPFFVRPVLDTKTFTGMVLDWGKYTEWRDSLLRLPETNDPVNDPLSISVLTPSAPTMVCSKKEIWDETRTWIVDRKVVTCSGYKMGTIKRYTPPALVDESVIRFAANRARMWSPNRAYVMDVALTPNGYKIVEVNNLNSAGWYYCDMQKLVMALEDMTW